MLSKQILRFDSLLLGIERVAGCSVAVKVLEGVRTLVAIICRRRRREVMENLMPRKSREDEARLEFERFLHW